MNNSAYIHIPFCQSICAYCDFTRSLYNQETSDKYIDVLIKEINKELNDSHLKTIYIGGGTPSALSFQQLEKLLKALYKYSVDVKEYTIEANVENLSVAKIECMFKYGVNRISLGVQSFDNQLLKVMKRNHNQSEVRTCIDNIRTVGITNISIDLMYGLPKQDLTSFKHDIEIALSLPITHISLYSLTIEDNTLFKLNKIKQMDVELESKMYEYACKKLTKNGYVHYEVANFAKDNKVSQHNLTYWHYDDFYGLGCGASGKQNHHRYDNSRILSDYVEGLGSKEEIQLTMEDEGFEFMMMGLRVSEGISLKEYEKRFYTSLIDTHRKALDKHLNNGNLILDDDNLSTSEQGRMFLHEILVDFLP